MPACSYCGSTRAMTKDDVVPLAVLTSAKRKGGAHGTGTVIDACSTCNAILGSKYLLTKARRAMHLVEQYANRLLWYQDRQEQDETLERIKGCVLAYERFLLEERLQAEQEADEDTVADDADDEADAPAERPIITMANWRDKRPDDDENLAHDRFKRWLNKDVVRVGEVIHLDCYDLLRLLRSKQLLPHLHEDDEDAHRDLLRASRKLVGEIDRLCRHSELAERWRGTYGVKSVRAALVALAFHRKIRVEDRAAILVAYLGLEDDDDADGLQETATETAARPKRTVRGKGPLTPDDEEWWTITAQDRARVGTPRFTCWLDNDTVTLDDLDELDVSDLLLLVKFDDQLPQLTGHPYRRWRSFVGHLDQRLKEVRGAKDADALTERWDYQFSIGDPKDGLALITFNSEQESSAKARVLQAFLDIQKGS